MVSVIIPVGPGHEKELINALDSLEAQTFRGWEAIVVWDSTELPDKLMVESYPHVTWKVMMPGGNGPGKARNFGATFARAPLLAFLDADDYYGPDFLRVSVNNFLTYDAVIYSDFVSIIPKFLLNCELDVELIRLPESGTHIQSPYVERRLHLTYKRLFSYNALTTKQVLTNCD